MADRDISIQIKATGGEAAAAEVKRAEQALDGLEKQALQTDAALDSMAASAGTNPMTDGSQLRAGAPAASGGGGRRSKGGAAAAMKEIAEEAPKATAGTRNLGAAAGQVGYQVQDFAVQVGAGTSALTAFAQQGSQLLGIFGPGGAMAGALLAIGAIAAKTFFEASSGSEELDASIDDLRKNLDEIDKKAAAGIAARDAQAVDAFAKSLQEEADSYARINEEIARNISLTQARRRAQAEIESARGALELAQIDADETLSEPEKIRRRAEVQERIEREKLSGRVAGIGERVAQAQGDFQTRQAAANAAQKAAEQATIEAESARQEQDRLAPRVAATRRLPGLRAELEQAEEKARQYQQEGETIDGRLRTVVLQNDRRLEELRKLIKEAEDIRAVSDEVRRFRALPEIIRGREEVERDRIKERDDARREAQAALQRRDQAAAEAQAEATGAINAFELQRQRRGLVSETQATTAERRAQERQAAEEAQAAVTGRESALESAARRAAGAFSGAAESGRGAGVDAKVIKTLEDIATRLSDGTSEAELARIKQQFESATRGMGSATLDALRAMIETQKEQAREITALKAKIKRGS